MLCSLQVWMSEYATAAACPPRSEPTNKKFLRPIATGRMARSQAECRVPNYAASRSAVAILGGVSDLSTRVGGIITRPPGTRATDRGRGRGGGECERWEGGGAPASS